jgi:hypothetical protein
MVRGVALIRKAAQEGVAEAQSNLAVFYLRGIGVVKDEVQGVYWARKAAEQRHAIAEFNLGVLYQSGTGVKPDHDEAERWFARAAADGLDIKSRLAAHGVALPPGPYGQALSAMGPK